MFEFEWPENFSIFLDNLCVYHVFFDVISFVTIIFTWWFCKSRNFSAQGTVTQSIVDDDTVMEDLDSSTNTFEDDQEFSKDEDYNSLTWSDDNIVSNIKIMRQKALVKEMQSKLTEDELEEEKKMEKKQLEKIFKLLQDQEEKFHMTSMEQVQDQLHLYRI